MALIRCPECKKIVSSRIAVCLYCDKPIKNITIETIKKRWEKIQLFFGFIFSLGILIFIGGAIETLRSGDKKVFYVGVVCAVSGLVGLLVGKIGNWLYHR
jgi:hypothetical protein